MRAHTIAAFFRRPGLLAGLLAIIGAVLCVHALSASEGMAVPSAKARTSAAVAGASSPVSVISPATAVGALSGRQMTEEALPAPTGGFAPGPSCRQGSMCAGMGLVETDCIPSPGPASPIPLAPPPSTSLSWAPVGPPGQGAAQSYIPGGPSPDELCVSRT